MPKFLKSSDFWIIALITAITIGLISLTPKMADAGTLTELDLSTEQCDHPTVSITQGDNYSACQFTMSNILAPQWNLIASTPDDIGQSYWTADFEPYGLAHYFSVTLGDKSVREPDSVWLRGYDTFGNLLAEDSALIAAYNGPYDVNRSTSELEISVFGISYVQFGVDRSGISAANIKYYSDAPAPVPVPAAGLLLLSALAAGTVVSRKRS